jgi:hypothetical protein
MSRLNQFKDNLTQGEKTFLAEYEAAVGELFNGLEARGALDKTFDKSKVERAVKLIQTSNVPVDLFKNFNILANLPERERDQILSDLDAKGFKVKNIPEQFGAVMCHMYQVMAERLKLHMVMLIDFSKLNLVDADEKPLGPIIKKLKEKFPDNKFVSFLSTEIRNAVTHYSYYFENGKLYLCEGHFDQSPKELDLSKFIIETKKLNILTESFFLIYLDKYRPNGNLVLEE